MSLSGTVFGLQIAVITAVLLAVTFVSIAQSRSDFHNAQGQRMLSSAESFASSPQVVSEIGRPQASFTLAPGMERTRDLSNASVVAIVDPHGKVIASSDPTTVGDRSQLVSSSGLAGRSWAGDASDHGQKFVAANVPVLTTSGDVEGIIIVAQEYPPLGHELAAAVPNLALFLGIGAALGIIGSWGLSRLVRRGTRGLEPHEITELADYREALLFSIREGVVGVDSAGRVTVINQSALDLLGLPSSVSGQQISALPIDEHIRETLLQSPGEGDIVASSDARILVLNQRSVVSRGNHVGTVTTLRDRTELAELQSQLAMNRSITETMRAQTHEFSNHLHTISGLVQLKKYDQVRNFIGTLSRRSAEIVDEVATRINDPAVAALFVAKASFARESKVTLTLDPVSDLDTLEPTLTADVITVVGNLIDNAIDAKTGTPEGTVSLRLTQDGANVSVTVIDSGPGIPDGMMEQIFNRGFTTKPAGVAGRGVGLALVRLICTQRGGSVSVEKRNPHGASFRATLPYMDGAS